jgi:hypothetical protein
MELNIIESLQGPRQNDKSSHFDFKVLFIKNVNVCVINPV